MMGRMARGADALTLSREEKRSVPDALTKGGGADKGKGIAIDERLSNGGDLGNKLLEDAVEGGVAVVLDQGQVVGE